MAIVTLIGRTTFSASVPASLAPAGASLAEPSPVAFLRDFAAQVLASAQVSSGNRIPGGPTNTTGHALRVPGGTQSYYPAFWIRDAAMMLGEDFVPASEIEGWVGVIAATQPGQDGLRFGRLFVPGYSIPDHITMAGAACWYPGAYTEQGNGAFGFLPPADDAFFFIQMVREHGRLTRDAAWFRSRFKTGWGEAALSEICVKAFDSVAAEFETGLVRCEAGDERSRVDWGFCDSIRKTGLCLMPSLLRWRAARDLAELFDSVNDKQEARRFEAEATKIQRAIPSTFSRLALAASESYTVLISATELGRKEDVWAEAYAVWLGVLPPDLELAIARHLLSLYRSGGTVREGQVRHLPEAGQFGGFWEQAQCERGTYQNGGYWATPTGWFVTALRKVDRAAADQLFAEYYHYVRRNRDAGAPWEWIQPEKNLRVNARYGSSIGLVMHCLPDDMGAKGR